MGNLILLAGIIAFMTSGFFILCAMSDYIEKYVYLDCEDDNDNKDYIEKKS